jgi:hypothetical protein
MATTHFGVTLFSLRLFRQLFGQRQIDPAPGEFRGLSLQALDVI